MMGNGRETMTRSRAVTKRPITEVAATSIDSASGRQFHPTTQGVRRAGFMPHGASPFLEDFLCFGFQHSLPY
jgi:hypothetical protein